jgi:integrase
MAATSTARTKSVGNGSGSVYQEGARTGTPGRWVAQVKIDDKYRRTYHPSEAKAKRALRTMLANVERGEGIPDGNMTLGELLERWRTKVLPAQNLSPATRDNYQWATNVLIDDIGGTRLRRLTPDVVEAAFEARAADGMSHSSFIKIRSVLGRALDYAQRRQLVTTNIARIVELPAEAERTEEGRAMTPEQARALLAHTEGHPLHAYWAIMLYLGLRPGETAGLTWPDIDLDNQVLHVRRSLKIENKTLVVDERLKTTRSRRSLDIPAPLADILREHRAGQEAQRAAAGTAWSTERGNLVFTTANGTPHHPRNIARTLTAATHKLDYDHWHPHELRHTAASLMSEAGIPIETIADQLGHDGTRMTLLIYRHATKPTVSAGNAMTGYLARER